MSSYIVETRDLTKIFRKKAAVDHLNLQMEPNSVMALLGPNGAGKTTTMSMLLGMLRPDSGSMEVLGMNPKNRSVDIRRRTGYVPERPKMIDWMSVRQILSFTSSFYSSWDTVYANHLIERFELAPDSRVRSLSRGEEAKLALILALAHRPELLILDDATSGIDPAARKDILEGLIGHMHEKGVAVLFATHLVHEIEGLADSVAVIMKGKLICCEKMEILKSNFRRVRIWSDSPDISPPQSVCLVSEKTSGKGKEWIVDRFQEDDWKELISSHQMEITDLSVEEIYLFLHASHKESAK